MLVVKRLAWSLLDCLRLLHNERIIHCDFKPVSMHTGLIPILYSVSLRNIQVIIATSWNTTELQ